MSIINAPFFAKLTEMFRINSQLNYASQSILDDNCYDNFDDDTLNHLSQSKKLMLKIDKLAKEKLNELLEPVRRGEMTLHELKRSRV